MLSQPSSIQRSADVLDRFKDWISGRAPKDVIAERERAISECHSTNRDAIQALQSAQRILRPMSGVITLNKRDAGREK